MTRRDEIAPPNRTMTVPLACALDTLSPRDRVTLKAITGMTGTLPPGICAVFTALRGEVEAVENQERADDDAVLAGIVSAGLGTG